MHTDTDEKTEYEQVPDFTMLVTFISNISIIFKQRIHNISNNYAVTAHEGGLLMLAGTLSSLRIEQKEKQKMLKLTPIFIFI